MGLGGMSLKWTISGDNIYMKQTMDLSVAQTWHSVGFSDVAPYNMGHSDFTVTMFNENHTGIRDLYKFDAGNNYPCWDSLHSAVWMVHLQALWISLTERLPGRM